jgi:hypothetical protein
MVFVIVAVTAWELHMSPMNRRWAILFNPMVVATGRAVARQNCQTGVTTVGLLALAEVNREEGKGRCRKPSGS